MYGFRGRSKASKNRKAHVIGQRDPEYVDWPQTATQFFQ